MREFTLDNILTVTTGCLVSRSHMDGLYDILGYMTNDPGLSTIGILAVGEKCAAEILRQHPQLAEIEVPSFDIRRDGEAPLWDWVEAQEAKYGKSLTVAPFGDSFDRETDLEVIQRVRGNTDNVIVVVTD